MVMTDLVFVSVRGCGVREPFKVGEKGQGGAELGLQLMLGIDSREQIGDNIKQTHDFE